MNDMNDAVKYNDPSGTGKSPDTTIKPCSLGELAMLYGMSVRTIKRWLQPFESEIGVRNGRYYTNGQVEKIFSLLGMPNG